MRTRRADPAHRKEHSTQTDRMAEGSNPFLGLVILTFVILTRIGIPNLRIALKEPVFCVILNFERRGPKNRIKINDPPKG